MKALIPLLTSSKGWLLRQIAKGAGIAGVWIAAKAQAAGAVSVTDDNMTAALTLLGVGVLEIGLSFLSRKNS